VYRIENKRNQKNHLIALIINTDKISLGYIQFLIFIEASLFTAFGFWHEYGNSESEIFQVISFIIFAIGIIVPIVIFIIVYRQYELQDWWDKKYKELSHLDQNIFPPWRNEIWVFKKLKFIKIGFLIVTLIIWIGWGLIICKSSVF
jgi:hypothetical protein